MDWRIKGLVQGGLSRTPGGLWLNGQLQRWLGGRRDVGRHIDDKVLRDWVVHAHHLRRLELPVEGRTLLEIGTGWLPVMPLCFAIAGLGRCISIDLNRHLVVSQVVPTLQRLERHLAAMAEAIGQPEGELRRRWQALRDAGPSAPDLLRAAGIDYRAPADASATGLAAASIDIVFSNSVLEHVTVPALGAIMRETRRLLGPDGLALHSVNCGDHYAYFDRSITPLNYLRFDDRQWARWNNDILYQNRLRPVDFLHAAREAGLEVVMDTHKPRADLLDRLPELPIAQAFRHYPDDELCCTSVDFAARVAR